MTRQEVYDVIKNMADLQGFYRQLLSRLNDADKDAANKFLDRFADCKDIIDVIMQMEQ